MIKEINFYLESGLIACFDCYNKVHNFYVGSISIEVSKFKNGRKLPYIKVIIKRTFNNGVLDFVGRKLLDTVYLDLVIMGKDILFKDLISKFNIKNAYFKDYVLKQRKDNDILKRRFNIC